VAGRVVEALDTPPLRLLTDAVALLGLVPTPWPQFSDMKYLLGHSGRGSSAEHAEFGKLIA
jgi:hypothetical protein